MTIKLGYSTCPNDTFVFEAMVHHRVDTEGLEFEETLSDVEDLNLKAFHSELDVTKLSFHAYAYLSDRYIILDSGSALGKNNGPLLLSREPFDLQTVESLKIAIPGKYTTANLLLQIAFPKVHNKVEMVFSEIEEAVLSGEADAGLAIHENRFTYASRGLFKLMDLGNYWEDLTGRPVPLGGIMIKRDLEQEVQRKVNRVLKRSVELAFSHPEKVMPYVRTFAQEMDEEVMKKHIALYVNDFTRDLGVTGKNAIRAFYHLAEQKKLIKPLYTPLFVLD